MEYQVGHFEQGDVYLDRLLDVMRLTAPGPTVTHSGIALVAPMVARIAGTSDQFDQAQMAAEAVLSSGYATPMYAVMARAGLAMTAVQRADAAAAAEQYAALESLGGTMLVAVTLAGIPQIKPTFLDIAPSGIPSNIIPHSKGIKCGLIRSNSPFSYSNHRPAKPKIPKPLVYAQVSPLGTSFATP